MKKWLRKKRKWIALTLVLLILSVSIYYKEFKYKHVVSYDIVTDIEDCCNINYIGKSYQYDSLDDLKNNPPVYEDDQAIMINHNIPFFTAEEKSVKQTFIELSELDSLSRSGPATALLNAKMLNTSQRTEDLSVVKPSGFVQVNVKDKYNVTFNYDEKDYYYLYNRCHLLAYSLGGPEVDERDIFTGTVSTNILMQIYEKAVSSFLRTHSSATVLYRVTPVFSGSNRLCSGVLLEGYSKDDHFSFCAYIFNIQEDFYLDYAMGNSVYKK